MCCVSIPCVLGAGFACGEHALEYVRVIATKPQHAIMLASKHLAILSSVGDNITTMRDLRLIKVVLTNDFVPTSLMSEPISS